MKRGEIWLVPLNPAEGHEQVLIISPDAFNHVTRVPVLVPITSGGSFARTAGFAVALSGAGTQTSGVVHCDQPRALDLVARRAKRLERVPQPIVEEVLAKFNAIFE